MEPVPECQTPFFLKAEVAAGQDGDDLVRLPAGGADDAGVRRHPGRGPGRRRPPTRCSPCPTTSTRRWAWRRRSARCGSAAGRDSGPAQAPGAGTDRLSPRGCALAWRSRSAPTSSARGATSASGASRQALESYDGDVTVTLPRRSSSTRRPCRTAGAADRGAGRASSAARSGRAQMFAHITADRRGRRAGHSTSTARSLANTFDAHRWSSRRTRAAGSRRDARGALPGALHRRRRHRLARRAGPARRLDRPGRARRR